MRLILLQTIVICLLSNTSFAQEVSEEYIVSMLSGYKGTVHSPVKKEGDVKIKSPNKKGAIVSFNITFDYASADIKEESFDSLIALGKTLEMEVLRGDRFLIKGHTDSRGSEEYNLKLSERRAENVKDFLTVYFDIEPENLLVKGMGKSAPVSPNDTDQGRRKNRRVEIERLGH